MVVLAYFKVAISGFRLIPQFPSPLDFTKAIFLLAQNQAQDFGVLEKSKSDFICFIMPYDITKICARF